MPPDFRTANIMTAGAYVLLDGRFIFAIGPTPDDQQLAVVRLGGHREPDETAWACAARETWEEAAVQIRPLAPSTTFWIDRDHPESAPVAIDWPTPDDISPILVVSATVDEVMQLSLMFLAATDVLPVPSMEVEGLLLIRPQQVHSILVDMLTLRQCLSQGGQLIARRVFDEDMVLDPLTQLRALAFILEQHDIGSPFMRG